MKTKKSAPFFFVEFFFMNLGYFVSFCKISRDFTDILIRKRGIKLQSVIFRPSPVLSNFLWLKSKTNRDANPTRNIGPRNGIAEILKRSPIKSNFSHF